VIFTQLALNNFRNIQGLSLCPDPSLNLITGNNAAGKSSILEAIQCLATGHSFRSRKPRELIKHGEHSYQVTGIFTEPVSGREHRAGLNRGSEGVIGLRLDFEELKSQSEITRILPVQAITPDSHKLVQDGPDERRRFLDWGLFHVEPQFLSYWQDYRKSLSQRNKLLREGAPNREIDLWTEPFLKSALQLSEAREIYTQRLQEALLLRMKEMALTFHVELSYRAGWDKTQSLADALKKNADTHRKMKTTTDGPHRSDIILTSDKSLVKHHFSRGQQKMLVYLLHLAQLDLLNEKRSMRAILLCDDLLSELDGPHANVMIEQLTSQGSQVFVTGVDTQALSSHTHKRFHMEHGQLEKGL